MSTKLNDEIGSENYDVTTIVSWNDYKALVGLGMISEKDALVHFSKDEIKDLKEKYENLIEEIQDALRT